MNWFIDRQTVILQLVPLIGAAAGLMLPSKLFSKTFSNPQYRHFTFFSALCAAAAFGVLTWVNRNVLFSFMNSADEHSCWFMAQYLAAGKLWAQPHALKEFFEIPHIGVVGDKWFSVYPPGWPMIWALGLKLHMKDLLNPLISALSVFWTLRLGKRIYGEAAASLAFFLLMFSPFFLLNGASYYSHNLCMLQMLLFLELFLNWYESGKMKWAAASALLLGWALATRYLTAAAMGFPAAAVMAWKIFTQKGKGLKSFAVFCFIFVCLNLLHLYYNFLITGDFLDAPNHFVRSHEKLGFIADYTPLTGLDYLFKRILYLTDWTPPGVVILFLFAAIPAKIRGLGDALARLNVLCLPLAYFFYYSWGGNQYGPRYLIESYPFLLLTFSARALEMKNKKIVAGFLAAVFISSLPVLERQIDFFRKVTWERRQVYAAAETELQKPAVVFINGFIGDTLVMAQEDTSRNSPFLNTPVVYAQDRGEKNKLLLPFFPERHFYKATYDRNTRQPRFETLTA